MKCYRPHCDSHDLRLAPLSEAERQAYPVMDIVGRICAECGWFQNHSGDAADPEPLTPEEAALHAPPLDIPPMPERRFSRGLWDRLWGRISHAI